MPLRGLFLAYVGARPCMECGEWTLFPRFCYFHRLQLRDEIQPFAMHWEDN